MRVFHYQIHVRLLIDIVEKRKGRSKREDADCGYRAEEQDDNAFVPR